MMEYDYEYLNKLLYYCEESPSFLRWRDNGNKHKKDEVAGCLTAERPVVRLDKRLYKISRVVWCLNNGEIDGTLYIDHIDRNSRNNKIDNLRLVSVKINNKNLTVRKTNKFKLSGIYRWKWEKDIYCYQYFVVRWVIEGKVKEKKFSIDKLGRLQLLNWQLILEIQ